MKVISGLGNSLLRKFCGKSAQNQQRILSLVKEDCRDDRITVEIDFRNNEILLCATEHDMEKAFCIVNNALECEARMLRNEYLERSLFPRRSGSSTLALFGSGAEIKRLELEKRYLTVEVMHQNAHDINERELISLLRGKGSGSPTASPLFLHVKRHLLDKFLHSCQTRILLAKISVSRCSIQRRKI